MNGQAGAYDVSNDYMYVYGGNRALSSGAALSNNLDYLMFEKDKGWKWVHVKISGPAPPPSTEGTLTVIPSNTPDLSANSLSGSPPERLIAFGGRSNDGLLNGVYDIFPGNGPGG